MKATCRYCGRSGELGDDLEFVERPPPERAVVACVDHARCKAEQERSGT